MAQLYILNGMVPEPVADLEAWVAWIETADRRVAETCIGGAAITVRTTFLGLSLGAPDADPPLLFETLVAGGPLQNAQVRYGTWNEAQAGHVVMVERVRLALRHEGRKT